MNVQLRKWLEHYNELMDEWRGKGVELTPELVRDSLARLTQNLVVDTPHIPLVKDHAIAGKSRMIPLRIYHPAPEKKLPVLLYLHGGGHMAGSIKVYDPICRKMALATRRIVISVDYRLAPEYPYPQGLEDAEAVLCGCLSVLDSLGIKHLEKLALAGDSAGGAMSATLAFKENKGSRPKLDGLALIYPSLDYTMTMPSIEAYSSGYLLEKERISWYFSQYFQSNEDRKAVSPLYMQMPEDFPRTFVMTAEYCPLHDEGVAFVEKLRNHNVSVQHVDYAGMVHAFMNMESLVPESCRKLYADIAEFLMREQESIG